MDLRVVYREYLHHRRTVKTDLHLRPLGFMQKQFTSLPSPVPQFPTLQIWDTADFEGSLQIATAEEKGLGHLVTRNLTDFSSIQNEELLSITKSLDIFREPIPDKASARSSKANRDGYSTASQSTLIRDFLFLDMAFKWKHCHKFYVLTAKAYRLL